MVGISTAKTVATWRNLHISTCGQRRSCHRFEHGPPRIVSSTAGTRVARRNSKKEIAIPVGRGIEFEPRLTESETAICRWNSWQFFPKRRQIQAWCFNRFMSQELFTRAV